MLLLPALRKVFGLRLLVPLALCALVPSTAMADIFDITFTPTVGSPAGSGSFTTDGSCTICTPGAGLLSFEVSFGFLISFDLPNVFGGSLVFHRGIGIDADLFSLGRDELLMDSAPQFYDLIPERDIESSGTYKFSLAPVPEPGTVSLLLTVTAALGLAAARKRLRRSTPAIET